MNIIKEQKITKEYILEKVGDYRIFSYYLPGFKLNRVMLSPMRNEKSPSFLVHNKSGQLLYKDFGASEIHGDCFNLVEQLYSLTFPNALNKIAEDFGLTKKSINNYEKVISEYKIPKKIEESKPPLLQISTRNFTKKEMDYWNSYYITEEVLKKENIVSIKSLWFNKQKITLNTNLFNFAYIYPDNKLKIYRPNAPKRLKETPISDWKWISNVPFDYCDNIKNIGKCDIVYLTKSKKDRLTLQAILNTNCICDWQAEDLSCINPSDLEYIKLNSNKQVVIFDADTKGKQASNIITKNFNMLHCNVPDIYLQQGINDFAELAKVHGWKVVYDHFKTKKLI